MYIFIINKSYNNFYKNIKKIVLIVIKNIKYTNQIKIPRNTRILYYNIITILSQILFENYNHNYFNNKTLLYLKIKITYLICFYFFYIIIFILIILF